MRQRQGKATLLHVFMVAIEVEAGAQQQSWFPEPVQTFVEIGWKHNRVNVDG